MRALLTSAALRGPVGAGVAGVDGAVAELWGSIRIFACVSGSPSASNALPTPGRPTVPVTSGPVFTSPSASMWRVSRYSSGEYPTTKRRSISLLIPMAGRIRSGSMQTPTTITRDSRGALAMISSMMPGTPTHSKMTGRFGPAPRLSATRQT